MQCKTQNIDSILYNHDRYVGLALLTCSRWDAQVSAFARAGATWVVMLNDYEQLRFHQQDSNDLALTDLLASSESPVLHAYDDDDRPYTKVSGCLDIA